jgi:hypothetical protein
VIANYAGLQSAIASWLNREDLTSVIPTFISLAEAGFNRALRVPEMIKRATATPEASFVALPLDWIEGKAIQISEDSTGKVRPLRYLPHEELDFYRRRNNDIDPTYYSITGLSLEIVPTPGAGVTVELTYVSTIPPLSEENPTNWLLTRAPDIYLYGALTHAAPFLDDDERLGVWGSALGGIIETLNTEALRSEVSGSPLVIRRRTFG